ncbi:uncharacterized protein BDV17DRAFT_186576 [Aspergillus undulatus]|uniref:uncharacterized protein n=1 Tax=Aspergillus undulatus TaxID=1810928 RepID=UPI003CCD40B5
MMQQHPMQMQMQMQMPLPMMMPPPTAMLPSSTPNPTPSPSQPSEPLFPPPQDSPATINDDKLKLPERDGDEALADFRQRFVQFCPFVYLPPDMSADQLKQKKPFLFEAILAVTARGMKEKQARAKHIKLLAANEILILNRSNLDLLIGLLTYVAWGNDHRVNTMNTMPRLMHLALSVMDALHLHKAVPLGSHMMSELGGGDLWPKIARLGNQGYLEDKRALLGCFLLNSFCSIYFSELSPMSWTPEMADALRTLEENPQWYGDVTLVAHVRMQNLVQKVRQARDEQETGLSIPFFTKTFSSQLKTLQQSFPPDIQKEEHIIAHKHYVELIIHETAHTADTRPLSRDSTPGDGKPIGVEAVECMWHALLAIRSWLTSYDKITPGDHVGFTVMTWGQMSLALVTLHRLSTHPAPDWDKEAARKTVNVVDAINLIRDRIKQIIPSSDEGLPDDFWQQVGWQTDVIRDWIVKNLGMEGSKKKTPLDAIAACESDEASDAPNDAAEEDDTSGVVDAPEPSSAQAPTPVQLLLLFILRSLFMLSVMRHRSGCRWAHPGIPLKPGVSLFHLFNRFSTLFNIAMGVGRAWRCR